MLSDEYLHEQLGYLLKIEYSWSVVAPLFLPKSDNRTSPKTNQKHQKQQINSSAKFDELDLENL